MDKPITVAMIEDDAIYQEAVLCLLNYSDFIHQTFAYNSVEQFLEDSRTTPDVILLDIQLPGVSGINGISLIQQKAPHASIIMLTMYDDDDLIFNAMCSGANGYILKTTSMKKIEDSILDVLNGGAAMSPYIAKKVLSIFTKFALPKKEYNLTTQEKNVLSYVVEGNPKKQIASKLFISLHTVQSHYKNIYAKLQVHSQTELVSKVLKERII